MHFPRQKTNSKTNCTVDSTFNLNIRYSISFRRFQIVVFLIQPKKVGFFYGPYRTRTAVQKNQAFLSGLFPKLNWR